MLTSDPIYNKPYKPAIYINSTSNASNFYTYDPWTDTGTTNKPTHCSLSLSENTHGKFTVQIEDGGRTLDRTRINKGARCIIKVGKYAGQMTQVLSGLIREAGDSRGSDRKDLYTLSGSSTSIRNNERIIYFVRQAVKLAQDGITIDINDPAMKAVTLLYEAYQSNRSIRPNNNSQEANLPILNINSLNTTSSQVKNFIADVNIEFGELQDAVNMIEEQSGSEYIVSSADIANLRYELNRIQGGKGFTIKNKTYRITGIDDDADDTMYLIRKNWKYSDSAYKSDSYSNVVSGIYPSEPEPSTEIAFTSGGIKNSDNDVAQKFRPTHSHFIPGDIFVAGRAKNDNNFERNLSPIMYIAPDSGGFPSTNIGDFIVKICIRDTAYQPPLNGTSLPQISNQQIFGDMFGNLIPSFNLDTNKDYWLIMDFGTCIQSLGVGGAMWWEWQFRTTGTGTYATAPSQQETGPWTLHTGLMWFAMPRRRSEAIIAHDPKGIKNMGSGLVTGGTPIESNLPSFPSIIKTKQAGYSYMANQLYYMAKPRANYNMPQVTAPNVPPLPGDPIVISDTVLNFSTPGNKVRFTRSGDLNLSWGSLDGSGFTYQAPTKLSISPVGNIAGYM